MAIDRRARRGLTMCREQPTGRIREENMTRKERNSPSSFLRLFYARAFSYSVGVVETTL